MKRIYLVGTSDDNKRLQLAQGKGAKIGSMELPISPKLRALLREVDAERLAKRGKKLPEEELKEQKARARQAQVEAKRAREGLEEAGRAAWEAEKRAREAERRAAEAEKGAHEAERRAEEAERKAEGAEKRASEAAARVRDEKPEPDGRPAKGGLAPGGFERATGVIGIEGVRAILRAPMEVPEGPATPTEPSAGQESPAAAESSQEKAEPPRRKKAEPMPETKLTPAEIQTLLRSGRGVRSVARQAEAPVDWVRRLAAPIESERLGIVTQLLQSYLVRARLGRSALPIGPSIVENLRDRGVRFPERVVEDGWTAWKPDQREWRVRFTFESRGRKRRADWRFEPQSRTVTAENDAAQTIAFRAPAEENGLSGASSRGRRTPKRGSSRKRSGKAATKPSARKRSTRKRSAGR